MQISEQTTPPDQVVTPPPSYSEAVPSQLKSEASELPLQERHEHRSPHHPPPAHHSHKGHHQPYISVPVRYSQAECPQDRTDHQEVNHLHGQRSHRQAPIQKSFFGLKALACGVFICNPICGLISFFFALTAHSKAAQGNRAAMGLYTRASILFSVLGLISILVVFVVAYSAYS